MGLRVDHGMLGPAFQTALAAAARGDDAAFRALWHDLQPSLLRYLRMRAPSVAEDLAAETWLEVVRGLDRFTGDEQGFRAWMFTIARHRVIDWHRNTARHPVQALPPEDLPDRAAPDDPATEVLRFASTQGALALIATLPSDQAEAVGLRVIAGLDVAQVAAIMGKRPGTVRVLAHRGLRRLAEVLSASLERRGVG